MNYTQSDIAALKAPDVLQTYCERTLGQGKRVRGKVFYACPYGAHTRLKLETTEKDGCGVALCRACHRGGSVFDVAAGVLGVDARKDFAACVEAVADAVGHTLTPDAGTAPKKGRRSRKAGFSRPLGVPARPAPAPAVEKPLEYLPPEMERDALAMVGRLRNAPPAIAHFAAMLGLPESVIWSHTDIANCAARGLLGVDAAGRLVYVYTHCPADGEPVRVLTWKARNPPGHKQRFDAAKGHPISTMWGADDIEGRHDVIITEGESDALAVRAAINAWHEIALHTEENYNPDTFPAVVAKTCAGHFKPDWAPLLKNKNVTLLIDNDKPGQDGAKKTAGILRAAGVRRVFYWTSPQGKDARAALNPAMPHLLATDIYKNRKEISQLELAENGETTK